MIINMTRTVSSGAAVMHVRGCLAIGVCTEVAYIRIWQAKDF